MALHEQHIDVRRITAAVSLLASIVEGSDDPIIAKNTDGIIISWNPAAERLFGYSEAEAVGQHISLLIPPERQGEERNILGEILAGRKVDHYETERQAKDGRRIQVSLTVSPLRDENGVIVGAAKIARDISQAHESRRLQAQLAAIVESSDDAIISKDTNGIITSWNPAAERLFGYSEEEAIGQPVSMLMPEDLAGRERDILGEILSGRKVDHYETRRVTKDGRVLDVSLTVSPLRGEGDVIIGASKIARDISEQRRLRERLDAAEKKLDELQAYELYDEVLQGQTVAKMAVEVGENELAIKTLGESIAATRRILTKMMRDAGVKPTADNLADPSHAEGSVS
jgi:PAS domain S-box-containing protein